VFVHVMFGACRKAETVFEILTWPYLRPTRRDAATGWFRESRRYSGACRLFSPPADLLSTGGKLIRPRKHRASPQLSVADTKPREADTAALRHSCGAAGARGQPCTPGQRQGWERRHSAAICLVGEQGTSVVLAGGCCAMPTGVATVRAECMARMSITCHASSSRRAAF
jgi:hypothetical protein